MEEDDKVDPILQRQQEAKDLTQVIDQVLKFPEKVTRPCRLPLSEVAFIEGDFVHTNEFIVANGDSGKDLEDYGLTSHTETAEILQDRLDAVQAQIALLRGDKEPKKAQKAVTSSKPSSDSDGSGSVSFLEIREFVDEKGREIDSQVVNMGDEMKDVSGLMEKLGLKGNEEENMGKVAKEKDPQKAKAFKAVEEKMKSFGEAQQMQDPETQFAYEMRATPEVQVPASLSQNLDFLSALEEQEDADKVRKEGLRKVEEESFGIGFKSGFLGGGGKRSPPKKKVTATNQPASVPAPVKEKRPVAFGGMVLEKNID